MLDRLKSAVCICVRRLFVSLKSTKCVCGHHQPEEWKRIMKRTTRVITIISILLLLSSCGISDMVSQVSRDSTESGNSDNPIRHSPKASSEYVGMDHSQAESTLRQAGFELIVTVSVDDIDSSSEISDGAVESVRINGIDEFSTSTEFSKDDEVVITYHNIPKIPMPMSLSDIAEEFYMDVGRSFFEAGFEVETDEVYDLEAGAESYTSITANGLAVQSESELPFDAVIRVLGHYPVSEFPVSITIEFESNWLANKYDVVVKFDGMIQGVLPHGQGATFNPSFPAGIHIITFESSKDENVNSSIELLVDSEAAVTYHIKCERKAVDVSEVGVTRALMDTTLLLPYSSSHYLRRDYQEVKSELETLGFDNVTAISTTDTFWAPDRVNSVVGITIDNISAFDHDQVFDRSVPVVLSYHIADFTFDQSSITVTERETFWLAYKMTSGDSIDSLDFIISNPTVIRRNEDGTFTALIPGTATVTATSGGHAYSTCSVKVDEIVVPIERVEFSSEEFEIAVGSSFIPEFSFFPEDANCFDVDIRTSNDHLEVSEGLVFYANEAGDTEVSIYQDDRFLGKCIIHAVFYDIEDLIFEETVDEVFVGEKIDLRFILFPENATAKGISVVSSDPGVADAFFDERGNQEIRVTAISPGDTVLTVITPNGAEFAHIITVKEVPPVTITVTNTNPDQRIEVGTPIQLEVSWNPDNTTTKELIWSSSDSSIITVDSEGNLQAVGIGTAEIIATHKTGVTGSITLTVERTLVYKVEVVSDWDGNKKFYVGDKFTLSASVVPENATDKTLIFTSDDESIAKVSDKGVVTATGVGTTTIIVTSNDGPKKRIAVTVSPSPQKFKITWQHALIENDHVGDEWYYDFRINGETFKSGSTIVLDPESSLVIQYWIEEYDESGSDTGYYSETIPYSNDLCKNGYTISTSVDVRENGGRYSGNYACWSLTVKITPVN